jgi:dTMP kinase
MIIVIEGMDAAGKATHSKLVAEKLGGTRFSFPNYETDTGRAILAHLKKAWVCAEENDDAESAQQLVPSSNLLDAMVFQSLQTVNRLEILPAIYKALAEGPVVFDRYWQSGTVYGGLDGLDYDWLRHTQQDPMPSADVNILIDIPVEEGFRRRPDRRDRYEANRDFLEEVREDYLKLWTSCGEGVDSRWRIINGLGSVDEVHARIMSVIITEMADK